MVQQFQDAMEEGIKRKIYKPVQEYMLAEIGELRAEVARLERLNSVVRTTESSSASRASEAIDERM